MSYNQDPTELQRRLAEEFARRGWEYDISTGRDIVNDLVSSPGLSADAAAARVPSSFLRRNGARRTDLAEAISLSVGSRPPEREPSRQTIVINDHRYSITVGAGAVVSKSYLNTGQQLVIGAGAQREDVLDALAALVSDGLDNGLNVAAVRDLTGVIEARSDVGLDDVVSVVEAVLEKRRPAKERAKDVITSIANNTLSGVLVTGITVGLAHLL